MPAPPAEPTRADLEPTGFFYDRAQAARAPVPIDGEAADAARRELANEVIAACEAELAKKPEAARAGRLHYEIARAAELGADDLERARTHYGHARELLPEHLPTIRGARRVLFSLGNATDALPLYDAEAKLLADPHDKAMLLYEKGTLLEDRLSQRKEARKAYAAAVALDEANPTILKAFERASVLAAEWDDVEKTQEREANAVSSDVRHRAALLTARAAVIDARKNDPERAIELYQTALSVDPHAPGALSALKTLLYAHERYRELVQVLEEEALQSKDAETRALARYRVARLYLERLGALDEAIQALESAVKDAPGDSLVLGELARAYELGKRWGKLAAVLEAAANGAASAGDRVALMHRIAQIHEERLGDADRAMDWYRRALDADPAYVPALQALGKLYAERGHFTALIAMHLGEAGASRDVTRRAAAHARVAEILERKLQNLDQAIEHHARALGLLPGYAPSFKSLVRLYETGGRFRELCELYERAVDQARDDETKITFLFKIGRVQEDSLRSPLAALAAYQRILVIDERHMGALHAVQRAAERGEAWEDLVAALDLEATKVSDAETRASLLHRAAEVSEDNRGDLDGAVLRYRKILAGDAKYAPALASLGRLLYRLGRFEELLATYQMELAVTGPGLPTAALRYKMGELAEERLGKDEEAISQYRAAVDADPRHLTAIRAVTRLLGVKGDFREVVRYSELECKALEDKTARARAALRVAEVYEHRLGDRVKALEAYERALSDVPEFRPALDGRARLLERAKDWKALAPALAREASASKDGMLAIGARLREGQILRDHLADPVRAVEAFEAVLAADPNHLGALLALEPLYAELGAREKLAQCLMAQARIVENGLARVGVLRELGRLEEVRIDAAPGEILDRYQTIVRLAPSDTSALLALERVAVATKNHGVLAHVDTKLAALLSDPSLVAAYQTRLAESVEITSGGPAALDTYRAALARDPDGIAAARGLSRIATELHDPALLVEAAEHSLRVLRDPILAATHFVHASRVRVERQRDVAGAVADLEKALEACPDHAEAARRLEDLLGAQDPVRLADVLSHAAGRAKDATRRAALWVTIAGLHADRRSDIGAGLASLDRALKEVKDYVPALLKQADLFARDGRAEESVERLNRVVQVEKEPSVLLVAHLALGALLDREVGNTAGAAQHLRSALAIDETNRGALGALLDVEMRREEFEAAAGTAAKLVAASPHGPDRADALTRLARLERRRGAIPEAVVAYRDAVAVTGVEGPALEEMRALFAELKKAGKRPDWDKYADGLGRYLDSVHVNDPRLAAPYLELARVAGDELGQAERAIQTLRAATTRFPADATLRRELSLRLRSGGHAAEAAEELRRLIDVDPLRAETFRELAECLTAVGRTVQASVATGLLVALGGGTDMDRMNAQSRASRVAMLEPGALDAETRSLLEASLPEDVATTRLLSVAALGLERAFPPDFEAFGVSKGDRISPRAGHPFRLLAERIGKIVGAPEFDVYIHHAHQGGIEVEFADPVALMVPAHLVQLPEAQQAFQLARVLVDLARGVHPIDKLAPSAIADVLVAAMRAVDPSYGSGHSDPEYIDALSKNLYRGLPRRARRPLEEAASMYGPSPKPRLDEWVLRARKTAVRAAIVVADDPAVAVDVLRRTEGDLARLEGAALERGMSVVADALRFSVSDTISAVRRRVGRG
ncbi:MAG TPA: tetratricopeptide repeat protein [Polyangiaceae bacterium]|nr:tetratricopeptide repeat protein [Polyangiaceae bacterium]